MPLVLKLRPKAESDLEDIWDYTLSQWGRNQAVTYLQNLKSAVELLADFPEMARLREEFTPAVRLYPVREHLIIYLVNGMDLEVIRVVHNRANWAHFLSE